MHLLVTPGPACSECNGQITSSMRKNMRFSDQSMLVKRCWGSVIYWIHGSPKRTDCTDWRRPPGFFTSTRSQKAVNMDCPVWKPRPVGAGVVQPGHPDRRVQVQVQGRRCLLHSLAASPHVEIQLQESDIHRGFATPRRWQLQEHNLRRSKNFPGRSNNYPIRSRSTPSAPAADLFFSHCVSSASS